MDREYFLAVVLALLTSIFTYYLPNASTLQAYKMALAFVVLAAIGLVLDIRKLAVAFLVIAAFGWLQWNLDYAVVFETHLALFFSGLFFVKDGDVEENLAKKVKPAREFLRTAGWAIALLAAIGIVLIGFSIAAFVLGVKPDTANVLEKIRGFPLHVILLGILFAPISEEIFFRGFLAQRFGILVSAIGFALSHFSYGSVFEIVGAFAIGLVFAYFYTKKRNLAACMFAHGLYNLISISAALLLAGKLVI